MNWYSGSLFVDSIIFQLGEFWGLKWASQGNYKIIVDIIKSNFMTSSNFRGKKEKHYFFNSYFELISQIFYSNFEREYSLGEKFNSSSKEYPCCILSMDPSTRKMRNTWKNVIAITLFSRISHFSYRISSEITRWVKNLIPHPRSTHVAYFRWTLLHEKWELHEKNVIAITFFHVFFILHVAGSIERMQHGYSLDDEINFASNEYSRSKFE